jgi:amidase
MSTPHAASWTVRDSAAMLDATAGPDIGDPYAVPMPARPFLVEVGSPPGRLRIGFTPLSPLGTPVDPECARVAREAAALCEELGHDVEEADAGYDAQALKTAWRVIPGVSVMTAVDGRAKALGIPDGTAMLELVNAEWIEEARGYTSNAYFLAVSALHRTARALGKFFQRYDVLLSPSTGELAPLLGEMASTHGTLDAFYDRFWSHSPFTCAFNAAGFPAMSVPLGTSGSGMPVGAHFGAGFGQDALLFRLAAQLEEARPWFARRPPKPFRSGAQDGSGVRAVA